MKLLSRFITDPPEELPEPPPSRLSSPLPELPELPEPPELPELPPEPCVTVFTRSVMPLFPLSESPPNRRFFPPSTKNAITAIRIRSIFPPPPPMELPARCEDPDPELPVRWLEEVPELPAGREAEGREAPVP